MKFVSVLVVVAFCSVWTAGLRDCIAAPWVACLDAVKCVALLPTSCPACRVGASAATLLLSILAIFVILRRLFHVFLMPSAALAPSTLFSSRTSWRSGLLTTASPPTPPSAVAVVVVSSENVEVPCWHVCVQLSELLNCSIHGPPAQHTACACTHPIGGVVTTLSVLWCFRCHANARYTAWCANLQQDLAGETKKQQRGKCWAQFARSAQLVVRPSPLHLLCSRTHATPEDGRRVDEGCVARGRRARCWHPVPAHPLGARGGQCFCGGP